MSTPSAGAPRTVFERHPRLTVAVLVIVSALLTDVVFAHVYFALAARLPGKARRPPATAAGSAGTEASDTAESPLKVKNLIFHHGFAPNMRGTNSWGPIEYPFVTNSLGFMDRTPRQVPLEAKGPRVVFIGDSFTEGVGVPYDKTFVGRIDTALAARGIEVLNAAALSYSPIIYYRKIKYFLDQGLEFSELVVFIDISDIQDEVIYRFDDKGRVVWDEARKAQEEAANQASGGEPVPDPGPDAVEGLLTRHTIALGRGYAWLRRAALHAPRKGAQTGRRRALWTVDPGFFDQYGRQGLKAAGEHMDQLLALLREHGIRLTVAVYPWPDQIAAGDLHSKQAAFWQDWSRQRGVDYIDYFPYFITGRPAREILEQDFIPGDVHWNEAGHGLVARVFLERYAAR